MEYQVLFNVAVGVAGFIGGWLVNRVFVLLDRIDADMKAISVQYVNKRIIVKTSEKLKKCWVQFLND